MRFFPLLPMVEAYTGRREARAASEVAAGYPLGSGSDAEASQISPDPRVTRLSKARNLPPTSWILMRYAP